jgi:hypothetical protein
MTAGFVTYRSYNDKALANDLCRRLSELGIEFDWESTEGLFDATFANNDILQMYYVRIRPADFARADAALKDEVAAENQAPAPGYYLYTFTIDELKDVLAKPDEWNDYDRYWAGRLLAEQGVKIDEQQQQEANAKRLAELKRPWVVDKAWIFCALAALVSGFFFLHPYLTITALFLSGYIAFSKKTMPNGERVPAFSYTDRLAGEIILAMSIVVAIYVALAFFK